MVERMDRVSPWIGEQNPIMRKRLGKLGEELGELQSAAMRCLIQGVDESSPDDGTPNRAWLLSEVADVTAMILCLQLRLRMTPEEWSEHHRRVARKKAAQRAWDEGRTVGVDET